MSIFNALSMGCIDVRKVISRTDWHLLALRVAGSLARERPKSYNFSFLVYPKKEMLDCSLPKENTVVAGIQLDPKNKSLYISLCSRFHKSNNIKLHTQGSREVYISDACQG